MIKGGVWRNTEVHIFVVHSSFSRFDYLQTVTYKVRLMKVLNRQRVKCEVEVRQINTCVLRPRVTNLHCVTISLFSAGRQFKWRPPQVCLPIPSPPCIPPRRSIILRAAPLARVVYWCKLSKWQILVAQTQSRHHSTAIEPNRHGLTSWLIALLIDCFPACGMRAVTLVSSHCADIKRKLLKLLHKYINLSLIHISEPTRPY